MLPGKPPPVMWTSPRDLSALEQGGKRGKIALVRSQKRFADGHPELRHVGVHLQRESFEERLPGQRVAVRVEARGGKPDQHVSFAHVAGQRLLAVHDAHDEPREIVVVGRVGAGHLRGLPADERTAELRARSGEAGHDLLHPHGVHLPEGDVVEEEERHRPLDQDVVHAVGHEVVAHGVVDARGARDLDLRPHAVRGGHEHGLLVAGEVRTEHRPEGADLGEDGGVEGPPREGLDASLGLVCGVDVDAGLAIVH